MERVYKEAVPGSTRIVNPKVQLEARLRELRPSGRGRWHFSSIC
jgi:general secretion pathway protein L